MRQRWFLALAVALLWCGAAAAQQMQSVTYYAEFHVRPGKEEDFMKLVRKFDEPMFEQLMKDGAVLAWGVDIPFLHEPGAPSHAIWWSVPDMGALDKVFAAFEENEKKTKAEEDKAAEEARKQRRAVPKSSEEMFLEAVDLSKHKDWLLRSLFSNFTTAAPPADLKPFGWITVLHIKPGRVAEFRRLWDQYLKPTYDRMVTDGSIIGYEFGQEEAKSTDDFTHYVWVVLPNLAAREKARNAFNAIFEARPPEARSQIEQSFLGTLDPGKTRVYTVRTILLRVAPPPK